MSGGSERRRWLVSGRVQGVFFRQSTLEAALRIGGLRGYVRNLPDGRVEIVAEGPLPKLAGLLAFIGRGPPGARVEAVAEEPAPTGALGGPFRLEV